MEEAGSRGEGGLAKEALLFPGARRVPWCSPGRARARPEGGDRLGSLAIGDVRPGLAEDPPDHIMRDGDRKHRRSYRVNRAPGAMIELVCLLVMIGVRTDGRKELAALADGFRESTESWADLLRSCKRRGWPRLVSSSAMHPDADAGPIQTGSSAELVKIVHLAQIPPAPEQCSLTGNFHPLKSLGLKIPLVPARRGAPRTERRLQPPT